MVKQEKSMEVFEKGSVPKAVLQNAVPAMIAMIMVLIYNMADTFFIGLTHDDLQVAAVSLATPVFLIFMALGTLFGVGGTSVISRAMGAGDEVRARKACAFCMWACVVVGIVCMALFWIFMDELLALLGASADTIGYTRIYLNIVVGCGVFSMIANCYANIIRAEGKPMIAMSGTLVGNLLNVVLDPIMILGFGWGIAGAAIATVIGNVAGALIYLAYYWKGKSSLSIRLSDVSLKEGIAGGVLAIGIPASLANILMSVSQVITNSRMAQYGDMAVAAYGVASKVLTVVVLIGIGLGQGVQPLLGYCFGAKNRQRFVDCMRFSTMFGLVLCLAISAVCFGLTEPIVQVFLTNQEALDASVRFTRIMLSTAWLMGAFSVCQNALQAMGAATPSLVVSVCRQGIVYIPAVFLMGAAIGMDGLAWAQPAADALSLALVIVLLGRQIRKMSPSAEE